MTTIPTITDDVEKGKALREHLAYVHTCLLVAGRCTQREEVQSILDAYADEQTRIMNQLMVVSGVDKIIVNSGRSGTVRDAGDCYLPASGLLMLRSAGGAGEGAEQQVG